MLYNYFMEKKETKTGTILRIPPLNGILIFNGATFLLGLSVIAGYCIEFDNGLVFSFATIPTIIVGILWLIFLVVTIFYFVRLNYYVIRPDGISHYRFNKERVYKYSDILYIDSKWSERHKKINLLRANGVEAFLPFDRNGTIYELMQKNCRHLLTDDQVLARFPGFKISIDPEYAKILKEEKKREKELEKEAVRNLKKKK